jgi:hypothetical protein
MPASDSGFNTPPRFAEATRSRRQTNAPFPVMIAPLRATARNRPANLPLQYSPVIRTMMLAESPSDSLNKFAG